MRNPRFSFWWHDIRHNPIWHLSISVGLLSLLLIVAMAAGLPHWMVRAHERMDAACRADGGRIEIGRSERGMAITVCVHD